LAGQWRKALEKSKAKTATHNFWKNLFDGVGGDLEVEYPNRKHSKNLKKSL
jgi:hypothetical protein